MATPLEFVVPATTASSDTAVISGSGYVSTTSGHSACALTGFTLWDMTGTEAAYSASWLNLITSNGNLEVDSNTVATLPIKIKYTYGGVADETNTFTVTVACPALTATAITPNTIDKLLDNNANTETVVSSSWITGVSQHPNCVTAFSVTTDAAGSTPATGTRVTVSNAGALLLDRAVLSATATPYWIKYTLNAGTPVMSLPVAGVIIKVECPPLVAVTPSAVYEFIIPNTASGALTTAVPIGGYLTNPSTRAACAVTFSLVVANATTTAVTTWLTVTTAGNVMVDGDVHGD